MSPATAKPLLDSIVFALLLGFAVQARADADVSPPLPIPAVYRSECGSCHVPYPPNLLPAGSAFSGTGWRFVMQNLHAHYGDDATLDDATRQEIERFLLANAAPSERRFRALAEPPRVTTTLWFHRTHGRLRKQLAAPDAVSAANCSGCHPGADQWNYAKKDAVTPPQLAPGR